MVLVVGDQPDGLLDLGKDAELGEREVDHRDGDEQDNPADQRDQEAELHDRHRLDPLQAQQVFAHTGTLPATHSFASIDNPNVTLTAVKKAEDADALIYRMYEWAGTATQVKLHVPPGATYAVETNLMEKVEGEHLAVSGDVVTIPIKPFEILTVMVAYPAKTVAQGTK